MILRDQVVKCEQRIRPRLDDLPQGEQDAGRAAPQVGAERRLPSPMKRTPVSPGTAYWNRAAAPDKAISLTVSRIRPVFAGELET
jgi:hypothetical protein